MVKKSLKDKLGVFIPELLSTKEEITYEYEANWAQGAAFNPYESNSWVVSEKIETVPDYSRIGRALKNILTITYNHVFSRE